MDNNQKGILESFVWPVVIAGKDVAQKISEEILPEDNKPKDMENRDWILFVPEWGPTDNQLV